MKTSCPQCEAVLSLQAKHVAQRNGLVRCGVCRHVFNALDYLQEEEDYPVLTEDNTSINKITEERPVVRETIVDKEIPLDEPRIVADEQDYYIDPREPRMVSQGEDDFRLPVDPPRSYYDDEDENPRQKGSYSWIFWFLAIVIALVLVVGQVFYVFRHQISHFFPNTRPFLVQMCGLFNCHVGLQSSATHLSLENVTLTVDDQAEKGHLRLRAVLRNQVDQIQELPTLILRLKNENGAVVSSKNLSPKEYLPLDKNIMVIPARGVQLIDLPFIIEGEAISGYELSIFYP